MSRRLRRASHPLRPAFRNRKWHAKPRRTGITAVPGMSRRPLWFAMLPLHRSIIMDMDHVVAGVGVRGHTVPLLLAP